MTREEIAELLAAKPTKPEPILPPEPWQPPDWAASPVAMPRQALPPEMTVPELPERKNVFERALPKVYDPLQQTQQAIGGAAFGMTGMGALADLAEARTPGEAMFAGAAVTPVGKVAGKGVKAAAKLGDLAATEKGLVGFAPGSVLSPAQRTDLPKGWRDLPGENAPFPQYATQYPPVGPPTMVPKDKPSFPGETYPEKTLTPQGEAFVKERNKIMADMKKTPYEPYYDPAKRFDVDPSKYPPANVDTLTIMPKKAKTLEDYEKIIDTPETRRLLREAYKRGGELGDSANWYAMGQLESDFIKELGPKAGRKAFLEEFAVPTAATTSGNKPINNLLMGHYFETLRKKGEPIPEGHQFPAPIGGRRANVNVRDYESVMEGGGYSALGAGQPKMHNFSRSFIGDLSRGVMDEQMAGGALAHAGDKAFVDKARTTGFGLLEKQLHTEAKAAGVKPGNFQDVAWAGFKDEAGRPMITEINDTIERTHRLTGMPRSEIVRRGFIKKEIPLYGAGGVIMGGLAVQDQYRQ